MCLCVLSCFFLVFGPEVACFHLEGVLELVFLVSLILVLSVQPLISLLAVSTKTALFWCLFFMAKDMSEETNGMSYNTSNRAVRQLIEDGIIDQVGSRQRNKRYKCQELLDILEEEDMRFEEEEKRQISLTETEEEL